MVLKHSYFKGSISRKKKKKTPPETWGSLGLWVQKNGLSCLKNKTKGFYLVVFQERCSLKNRRTKGLVKWQNMAKSHQNRRSPRNFLLTHGPSCQLPPKGSRNGSKISHDDSKQYQKATSRPKKYFSVSGH